MGRAFEFKLPEKLSKIHPSVLLCVFFAISLLFFRPVAMAMRLKNASI